VVSEERGTISLAREERIQEIANASALRIELETFFAKRTPLSKPTPILNWLKKNQREKVLAIVLAGILWVVFGYQRETIGRDFVVPIEYVNTPVEWVLEEPKVMEVKILLMGPTQAFQLLHPETMRVSVDLAQLRPGTQEIILTQDMIKAPSNLSVASISPGRIKITTSRLLRLTVPIEVLTENNPPREMSVQGITVSPAEAQVLIPRQLRGKKIRVMTEPIDLSLLDVQSVFTPPLRYPPDIQFAGGKAPMVRVVVKTLKKTTPSRR
jgi:YbbR domain-containing protein